MENKGVPILICGNPSSGFTVVGPFDTPEKAIEYGESLQDDWWIDELVTPED